MEFCEISHRCFNSLERRPRKKERLRDDRNARPEINEWKRDELLAINSHPELMCSK